MIIQRSPGRSRSKGISQTAPSNVTSASRDLRNCAARLPFGFAITAVIGLAYFIYYIWNFISTEIDPKIEKMHFQLIRVIDQVRMLDNDLIRLQEKVNVVL